MGNLCQSNDMTMESSLPKLCPGGTDGRGPEREEERRGALELLLNSSPSGSTLTQHASVHGGPLPGLCFDSVSSAVA